jgi:hypothetical protein
MGKTTIFFDLVVVAALSRHQQRRNLVVAKVAA